MKMMQRETEEKNSAVAQILVSIPLIVWRAFFFLIISLVAVFIIARFFPATAGISIFARELTTWLVRVLVVSGSVIAVKLAYGGYLLFHDFRIKHVEYHSLRLNNEMKEVKILRERAIADAATKFADLAGQGLAQGLNVDFLKMSMSSPFSNVHTLGNGQGGNIIDAAPFAQIAAPQQRLTVEEICSHIERNSYRVFIGSSLHKNYGAPVPISIKGRHLKIIGASQKGKSSMVAALIDIVSSTHDTNYVQFALLDKEHQTSRLFADLPHVLTVVSQDKEIPLHAKSTNEVVEYLGYLLQILEVRNAMSRLTLSQEPIIIVYIEEFLRLKKELQSACATAKDKDEAARRYAQFSFAIGQLAGLGLKLRMQLWVCAQMDYADKDKELQEAMVNITSGLSFCVRQTAALAAGFYNTELLARNAQENKAGQAVCEMPDCNDLILAPDYDLEKRLIAREEAEIQEEEQGQYIESERAYTGPYLLKSNAPTGDSYEVYKPATPVNDTPPALPIVRQHSTRKATLQDAIEVWNEYQEQGIEIGRPRLREELQARGLECSDDLAKALIKNVKARLEKAE